jgi:hypothetical protein
VRIPRNPARQGADIGSPVPPDFSLISDATRGDAHKFPVHGPGDGLTKRGLAKTPGGPLKQRIGLCISRLSLRAAKNSRIRFLFFFRP